MLHSRLDVSQIQFRSLATLLHPKKVVWLHVYIFANLHAHIVRAFPRSLYLHLLDFPHSPLPAITKDITTLQPSVSILRQSKLSFLQLKYLINRQNGSLPPRLPHHNLMYILLYLRLCTPATKPTGTKGTFSKQPMLLFRDFYRYSMVSSSLPQGSCDEYGNLYCHENKDESICMYMSRNKICFRSFFRHFSSAAAV